MFALPAQRSLYTCTWFCQYYFCSEVSKVCRAASNFSTSYNEVNCAVKKARKKQSTAQKTAIQNNEIIKKPSKPVVNKEKQDLGRKWPELENPYTHNLSDAEMKILHEEVSNILILKALSSFGADHYKKQTEEIFKLHRPTQREETVTNAENLNSIVSDFEKGTPKVQEFLFPLDNTLTNLTKEEAIALLKSKLPRDLHVGEDFVSSSQILEYTSNNKDDSQKILRNNEDKLILENHLSSHLANYLRENAPTNFPYPKLPEHLMGYWKSMLPMIRKITDVKGIDVETTHPVLHYSTTADIICSFGGNLVVMDWKTHLGLRNSSLSAHDYMLESVACLGALNFDVNLSLQEPLHAVSLVSYPSGNPAHALCMKPPYLQLYWKNWLQKLSIFYKEKSMKEI